MIDEVEKAFARVGNSGQAAQNVVPMVVTAAKSVERLHTLSDNPRPPTEWPTPDLPRLMWHALLDTVLRYERSTGGNAAGPVV